MTEFIEKQNQVLLEIAKQLGRQKLGLMANMRWHHDPKHLLFMLARYKFVAKLLSGKESILEVGCGDAFGSKIVKQEVNHLTVSDVDPIFIKDAKETQIDDLQNFEAFVHDFVKKPMKGTFDGIYMLDVFEHIDPDSEDIFVLNILKSLSSDGVLIVGIPSLESQKYASEASKLGHVNCKNADNLRKYFKRHFANVFLFSMNDEVVHTGFFPMAHYLIAVCCQKI